MCNKIPKDFSEQMSNSVTSSQASVPSQSTKRRYGAHSTYAGEKVGHQQRMLILAEDDDGESTGEEVYDVRAPGADGEHGVRRSATQYDILETANFPAYRKDKAIVEADGRLLVIQG